MTKEEAKHLSEVLKAYSESKVIQVRHFNPSEGYTDWKDCDYISFYDTTAEYRVKPEPKFRPYANAEEFLQAQKEHGMYLISKKYKDKILLPISVLSDRIFVYWNARDDELTGYLYSDLFNYWTHQDGTPCGILE